MIKLCALLSLIALSGCSGSSSLSSSGVVEKGARILGMDTNDAAADYTFLQSYAAAQSIGVQAGTLHVNWNQDETAASSGTTSGTFTDTNGALASANAFYPTTSPASFLSLTIAPIDTGALALPADISGLTMNNPIVMTRFNNFMTWVLGRLTNTTFTSVQIGNEIDTLPAANTASYWSQYATFLASAVAHIHSLKPGVKVGVTVTLYGITGQGYAGSVGQAGINTLAGIGDELGVTYYPLDNSFMMKDPSVVATETAQMFSDLSSTTSVYFQEVGYASSSLCAGSQANQTAFIDQIFSMWDAHASQVPFLSFVRMNDYSIAAATSVAGTLSSNAAFVAYLQTLGLRSYGAPSSSKSAWTELQAQTQLRGW